MNPKDISIKEYTYDLPKEKIAQFPLKKRDRSKLLLIKKDLISQDYFYNVADHLPGKSIMVFNNTKVIQARLLFQKASGATIEVFCLEPLLPESEIQSAFQQTSPVVWRCFVGNARRWKSGEIIKKIKSDTGEIIISARHSRNHDNTFNVEFAWQPSELNFSKILNLSGLVPLPPYINREATETDKKNYQTVYAQNDGSVAAPTAGLHFTKEIFESLKKKNIISEYVTLHVGAGTFSPVVNSTVDDHKMHMEQVVISRSTIANLISNNEKKIIAVGTTTVRTLESLYWFGRKLLYDSNQSFNIQQWDPYEDKTKQKITRAESLDVVLKYMDKNRLTELTGTTRLIIIPGYNFKAIDALITNFHQPRSTLLLLVAALSGDVWRQAYDYALKNDFRFLSYGDSSLFLP
jgi:S-adenosylmethionine:tRNA ribosyltransferase-isomerase